jgi:uncharacterized membrane protein
MRINSLGIIAGILTALLPFTGYWWHFGIADFLVMNISPFKIDIVIAGERLVSPLLEWFCRGLTAIALLSGFFLFVGSLNVEKWWGVKLIRFGSLKILFLVISFLVSVLILPVFTTTVSERLDVPAGLQIPFHGVEDVVFEMEGVKISFKVFSILTQSFWLACITAIFGLASRIHLRWSARKVLDAS